eukprot:maker-scaffold606_size125303-snap-gene-0.18 protein:Tk03644 transcript:maker-scaffold606_size125303-snap-gene-0.18-mRNA-1 annotation:"zinc finger protein"
MDLDSIRPSRLELLWNRMQSEVRPLAQSEPPAKRANFGAEDRRNSLSPPAQERISTSSSPDDADPSNPRYKTEVCRNFKERSKCIYGDQCQFAHGRRELRDVVRNTKYKTKHCQKYWITGYCAYGPRCNFLHNERDEQPQESRCGHSLAAGKPHSKGAWGSKGHKRGSGRPASEVQKEDHQERDMAEMLEVIPPTVAKGIPDPNAFHGESVDEERGGHQRIDPAPDPMLEPGYGCLTTFNLFYWRLVCALAILLGCQTVIGLKWIWEIRSHSEIQLEIPGNHTDVSVIGLDQTRFATIAHRQRSRLALTTFVEDPEEVPPEDSNNDDVFISPESKIIAIC